MTNPNGGALFLMLLPFGLLLIMIWSIEMSKFLKSIIVALASAVVMELSKVLEQHTTSSFTDVSKDIE